MIERIKKSMTKTRIVVLVCVVACVGLIGFLVEGRREISVPPTLRTSTARGGGEVLEVPIARYASGPIYSNPAHVDFVGAIHLGDKSYYEKLNERFKGYDAVLFELVSDGSTLPTQNGEQVDSLLGTVQRAFSNLLGLAFQLDVIDYQARNFVHADLSPAELSKAMSVRGESVPQLLMRLIRLSFDSELQKELEAKGLSQGSLEGVNPLLIMLRGPTPEERVKLRRFMAKGLLGSDTMIKMLEGENGVSLITDRNAAIIKVLRQELAAGKRRIAIFYGAGHLPDLHKRLTSDLGYKLVNVEWVPAWTM